VRKAGYSGVVYIDPEEAILLRPLAIEGHWEPVGRVPEEGPGWATAAEAIAWGRRRAPEVLLRLDRNTYRHQYLQVDGLILRLAAPAESESVTYAAGETQVPYPGEDVRRWPGASDVRETDAVQGYSGTVHLAQRAPESDRGEPLGYLARWEVLKEGSQEVVEVAGPAWNEELDLAVRWGRERAPYVLVREVLGSGYVSAGERDPSGLQLPRWEGVDALDIEPDPNATWFVVVSEDDSRHFPISDEIEPAGGLPEGD
jgi:hypothetical protein